MSKKLICIVISLVILVSLLAGCGGSAITNNETTAVSETKSNTAESVKQENVTISFVNWNNKDEEKPVLEAFMAENPNIKVEHSVLQGDQYGKLLRVRLLSGDAPDVFTVMAPEYSTFTREGYLLDVTEEAGTKFAFSSPGLDVFQKIDGKIYGAPTSGAAAIQPIYYNKKIFTQLNLSAPKNLVEFYAVCEKIKAAGIDPLIFGGKDSWTMGLFNYVTNTSELNTKYQPGLTEKVLKGEVKIADIYRARFNMIEDMAKKGYFGKATLTLSYDQSVQYFLDGKCAIFPNGTWHVQDKNVIAAKDFELGVFFPPVDQIDGKYYLSASNNSQTMAVSAKSTHLEEAKKLYNFFFTKENLVTLLNNLGYSSLIPNLGLNVDPALKEFNDQVYNSPDKVNYFIVGVKDDLISTLIGSEDKCNQNLIAGSTTEKELKQMEADFEKIKPSIKLDN